MVESSYQSRSELCKVMLYPHCPRKSYKFRAAEPSASSEIPMHCAMDQLYYKHFKPVTHSNPGHMLLQPIVSAMSKRI